MKGMAEEDRTISSKAVIFLSFKPPILAHGVEFIQRDGFALGKNNCSPPIL